jgi:Mce-associated membrane protein
MEGDAGTSRLNPTDEDSLRTEVQAEDSPESESGTEQITTELTDDSTESAAGPDAASEAASTGVDESAGTETTAGRRPSRVGRRWLAGIAAALLLAAGGLGVGGYFALKSHHESQVLARNSTAALEAAKVCIAATQAPDTNAMAQSERKIIECGTDEYRSQALLYTSMLVQAYQAANVHVQVTDERAAVERSNDDGTVDILVALRVKVSNATAQNQETGYRLRVKMSPVEGQYKIAKLNQVTK